MAARAGLHLAQLAATPRPAGGQAERAAREYCARQLRERGFLVAEEPVEFSALPGRWATPAGGVLAFGVLAAAGHLGDRGHAAGAFALLSAGALLTAVLASLGARGVLTAPWLRTRTANLVARRGSPTLWLMAHLDSKSQPVPIAIRALGVMGLVTIWLLGLLLASAQWGGGGGGGAGVERAWLWLVIAGAVAAAPVAASVVGARSPGAVDDASGVAVLLRVAEDAPPNAALGFVFTSGEELGLAGARAWVRGRLPGRAINVDGVDDRGRVRFTYSGPRPPILAPLLAAAASSRPSAGPLVPGVLLDGVALASAGWDVVTISKGDWNTVTRVHTPRDSVSALDGTGVEAVAAIIGRAIVESLRDGEEAPRRRR
ncbi:MAG TPA: M28 family peptidase [Candidatus Methylomirabilis sp.]|nr:M28 family peptidase [Gemmatimonadaceae bacterium]HYB41070.1 M28 family peptidase [Candidatus Methylomirabilis sp.]